MSDCGLLGHPIFGDTCPCGKPTVAATAPAAAPLRPRVDPAVRAILEDRYVWDYDPQTVAHRTGVGDLTGRARRAQQRFRASRSTTARPQ